VHLHGVDVGVFLGALVEVGVLLGPEFGNNPKVYYLLPR